MARPKMLSGLLAIVMCIVALVASIGSILVIVERTTPASEPVRNLKIVSVSQNDSELAGLKKADRLQQNSNIQIARAESKTLTASESVPEPIGLGAMTMAFAPATADINSPFYELLRSDADQFNAHVSLPRMRPEKILVGHGPLRRRPGVSMAPGQIEVTRTL